nr:hypothetical protein [Clostridia bacterium]
MAKSFNELLQEFVNKSYDELLNIASGALNVMVPAFNSIADDGNGAKFVIPFMCTTLAVDGSFTELEYKFLNDLLGGGVDYAGAKAQVQAHYSADMIEIVDQIIDACGEDLKTAILVFCLCFTAVDETITRDEAAFIAKLIQ